MDKYNFDEIYEVLTNFVDYTKECKYDIPDLLYYLKFKLGIDCLEEFNNIENDYLDDDTSLLKEVKDAGISEKDYYNLIFNEVSEENQVVLDKLARVINDYLKTGIIPDPYIETEEQNKVFKKTIN